MASKSKNGAGLSAVWAVGAMVLVVFIVATMAGCEVGAGFREQVEVLTAEVVELDQEADRLAEELAVVEEAEGPGSDEAGALRDALVSTETKRDLLIQELIAVRDASADGTIDSDEAGQIVGGAVSAFLPGYGPLAGLAASIVFGLWERYKRRRTERANAEVVHSVDVFLDTMTSEQRAEAKKVLRANQPSQEARALVSQGKGKK